MPIVGERGRRHHRRHWRRGGSREHNSLGIDIGRGCRCGVGKGGGGGGRSVGGRRRVSVDGSGDGGGGYSQWRPPPPGAMPRNSAVVHGRGWEVTGGDRRRCNVGSSGNGRVINGCGRTLDDDDGVIDGGGGVVAKAMASVAVARDGAGALAGPPDEDEREGGDDQRQYRPDCRHGCGGAAAGRGRWRARESLHAGAPRGTNVGERWRVWRRRAEYGGMRCTQLTT